MATTKIVDKPIFMLIKKEVKKYCFFLKLQNQLKLLNLVTIATNKFCIKVVFDTNKKVETKILDFGKLFRTTVVSMAKKSYNKLKFLNLVTMATMTIV